MMGNSRGTITGRQRPQKRPILKAMTEGRKEKDKAEGGNGERQEGGGKRRECETARWGARRRVYDRAHRAVAGV